MVRLFLGAKIGAALFVLALLGILGLPVAMADGVESQVQCGDNCRSCGNVAGSNLSRPCFCGNNIGGSNQGCLSSDGYQTDLFHNYYVAPDCGDQYTAVMYYAPYPTPTVAGRVYYTYQPFLPHQLMYHHSRVYKRSYNGNQGLNRTIASHHSTAWYTGKNVVHWLTKLPR